MNKLVKVLAATAMAATVLVGCKKAEPEVEAAKYAKVGLGVVSSYKVKEGNPGEVNSTIAVVGLDKDGKVQYCYLDVAQSAPTADDAKTLTKKALKEDYGMKNVPMNTIGKEWYEQAEAFENYCIGKTAEEVAAIKTEVKDEQHPSVPADADLKAGCTMNVGEFKEALAKAFANAKDAAADKIGVGIEMAPSATDDQLNTTISVVALDKDGKVVASEIDVAQISKDVLETKSERKEAYGMKNVPMNTIGKEWYEQADFLEEYIKGKTAADVAAIETFEKDEHHKAAPKEGSDLAAGCTMDIGSFKATLAEAMK